MRSMVEGIEPRVAGRNDRLYGLVQVCRYIACCNTERRDAMGHQPGIPHQIELGPIAHSCDAPSTSIARRASLQKKSRT